MRIIGHNIPFVAALYAASVPFFNIKARLFSCLWRFYCEKENEDSWRATCLYEILIQTGTETTKRCKKLMGKNEWALPSGNIDMKYFKSVTIATEDDAKPGPTTQ